jgi:hypothetical protein
LEPPYWFTRVSRESRLDGIPILERFLRLAYWIVGDLPVDWHLSLFKPHGEQDLLSVVFVSSKTGKQSLIDPRLDSLPDIGFERRLKWFESLKRDKAFEGNYNKLLFNISSRDNIVDEVLVTISSSTSDVLASGNVNAEFAGISCFLNSLRRRRARSGRYLS